jgi:hypothetical protein
MGSHLEDLYFENEDLKRRLKDKTTREITCHEPVLRGHCHARLDLMDTLKLQDHKDMHRLTEPHVDRPVMLAVSCNRGYCHCPLDRLTQQERRDHYKIHPQPHDKRAFPEDVEYPEDSEHDESESDIDKGNNVDSRTARNQQSTIPTTGPNIPNHPTGGDKSLQWYVNQGTQASSQETPGTLQPPPQRLSTPLIDVQVRQALEEYLEPMPESPPNPDSPIHPHCPRCFANIRYLGKGVSEILFLVTCEVSEISVNSIQRIPIHKENCGVKKWIMMSKEDGLRAKSKQLTPLEIMDILQRSEAISSAQPAMSKPKPKPKPEPQAKKSTAAKSKTKETMPLQPSTATAQPTATAANSSSVAGELVGNSISQTASPDSKAKAQPDQTKPAKRTRPDEVHVADSEDDDGSPTPKRPRTAQGWTGRRKSSRLLEISPKKGSLNG